jgi:gamma-glutamylcyclotransferase (GGCT)/AIG2-like uncharacterized protein YtfP
MEKEFVFVCGALMRKFHYNYLLAHATFTGNAVANGKLYATLRDEYSSMVKGDGEVFGEVYEVDKDTINCLDWFKRYNPSDKENNIYVREEIPVVRDDGKTVKAWAYFYNNPVPDFLHVPSGNWRGVARLHE